MRRLVFSTVPFDEGQPDCRNNYRCPFAALASDSPRILSLDQTSPSGAWVRAGWKAAL